MQKSQLNILSEEGFRAVEEGYLRGGVVSYFLNAYVYICSSLYNNESTERYTETTETDSGGDVEIILYAIQ